MYTAYICEYWIQYNITYSSLLVYLISCIAALAKKAAACSQEMACTYELHDREVIHIHARVSCRRLTQQLTAATQTKENCEKNRFFFADVRKSQSVTRKEVFRGPADHNLRSATPTHHKSFQPEKVSQLSNGLWSGFLFSRFFAFSFA